MTQAPTQSNRRERRRQEAAARKAGTEPAHVPSFWTRDVLICLVLLIGTFALYARAIGYPFIEHYDDEDYITDNLHVQAGLSWQTLTWAVTAMECQNWHPVTWLSHATDCDLYGLNPAGHHLTNIILHALNVGLLFLLLKRATRATARSAIVAALFAVHPYAVESVAWIAERKNVLSMFFFLLTLGAYGWYALQPSVKRYLAVTGLFILGLASKPMVITLPCVLMLLDYWPLKRIQGWAPIAASTELDRPNPQFPLSSLILEKLPLLVLSAGSALLTMQAQHAAMHLVLPLSSRVANAVYAYALYIWKAFWPAQLAVFYPHPGTSLAPWRVALAAAFLLAVSIIAWMYRASRPYLLIGWLWYLGTLVPMIGLVQVGEQSMADRYTYLSLIGVFVMVVWAASDLADARHVSLRARAVTVAIIVGFFCAYTWEQVTYWRSSVDLWSHAVDVTHNNYTAELNLGIALMTADRASDAVPHLQNATHIRPHDATGYLNLAGALQLNGQAREAIPIYLNLIQIAPDSPMLPGAYENLGRCYEHLGDYQHARQYFETALKVSPQRESTKNALDNLDLSEAMRNASESPSAPGFLRLGQLLQNAGRLDQARAAYQQALDIDPKNKDAQAALQSLGAKE